MNSNDGTLRIYIVDDYEAVRDGLRSYIAAQPDWTLVGEADCGVSALKGLLALEKAGVEEASGRPATTSCGVDVVVLDTSLPDCASKDVCARIKARWPAMQVLALATQEEKANLYDAFAAGVSGYALKRSSVENILRAIRAVAVGSIYIDPLLSGLGADILGRGKRNAEGLIVRRDPADIALSEQEEKILQLISRGGKIIEICKTLCLSPKSVETYRGRAMQKLGLTTRADLIRYGVGNGWLNNLKNPAGKL